jgi:hypothetical protein
VPSCRDWNQRLDPSSTDLAVVAQVPDDSKQDEIVESHNLTDATEPRIEDNVAPWWWHFTQGKRKANPKTTRCPADRKCIARQ